MQFFMLIYLHNIFEFLSLLIAIIYYRYLKVNYMKWFLPFLAFVFVGEMISIYRGIILGINTITISHLIAIVETIFYGFIFYLLTQQRLLKKGIQFLVPFFVVCYLSSLMMNKKDLSYFALIITVSGFFFAAIALIYLYEKFSDDNEILLISEPGFWIAVGVTLFYSGISISFSLYDYILKNNLTIYGIKLYKLAPRIFSIILYTCISISMILCKKKSKI